jgi:hypothetical protein
MFRSCCGSAYLFFFWLLSWSLDFLSLLLVECFEPVEYSTGYIPTDREEALERTDRRFTTRKSRDLILAEWKYVGIYPTGSAAYSTRYVEEKPTFAYVGMYEGSVVFLAEHDYPPCDLMWPRDSSAGCSSRAFTALWRATLFTPSLALEDRNLNTAPSQQFWGTRLPVIPKLYFEGQGLSMLAGSYRSGAESWLLIGPCAQVR